MNKLLLGVFLLVPVLAIAEATWASDPVIKSEGCESLEYVDVAKFMGQHYYPAVSNLEKKNAATNFVNTYTMSTALIMRSQACLAHALELKELSKELQTTQQLIAGGTSLSKQEVQKHRQLTAKANEEITKAAEQQKKLTPKQQKSFSLGTSTYLTGTYATVKLFDLGKNVVGGAFNALSDASKGNVIGALGSLGKSVTSLVSKDTGKVKTLVSGYKDHAVNIYDTSKFLINFSKKNNIKLPTDATKDLAAVSDWI